MASVRATAHPNIALVKYWGKKTVAGNIPAVPSLSITLDSLTAITELTEATSDQFVLNGEEQSGIAADEKLTRFLAYLRERHDVPPLTISSHNNFPTAAGLASSAAGFAALVTAVNELCELNLNAGQLSELARAGSASAARSIFGGFVGLTGPRFIAEPIATNEHWPLQVVVAITNTGKKSVSSTEGMTRSAATSPYYSSWLDTAGADYARAHAAINTRNFTELAEVSEHSCLKMHAVMQTTQPPLMYWNPASLACIQKIQDLRAQGIDVFFTVDAGPQIKAVCTRDSIDAVATILASMPGVLSVEKIGLGGPAQIKD